MIRQCEQCSASFETHRIVQRFCSKRCARLFQNRDARRNQPRTCELCGDDFGPLAAEQRFCSIRCANTHLARTHAPAREAARRGTGTRTAYVKRNGRHEHRVVAEEMLGRPLAPGEVVHHINGDTRDNRPENLQVLPSQAEHARIHALELNPRHRRAKERT